MVIKSLNTQIAGKVKKVVEQEFPEIGDIKRKRKRLMTQDPITLILIKQKNTKLFVKHSIEDAILELCNVLKKIIKRYFFKIFYLMLKTKNIQAK